MLSNAWDNASLSISFREVMEAKEPRRDRVPPISGSSTEDADGEVGSGAILQGRCCSCRLLS